MADQLVRASLAELSAMILSIGEIGVPSDNPNFVLIGTDALGGVSVLTEAGASALGGGATAFLALSDTPGSFGTPGHLVAINGAGNALEFVAPSAGGGASDFLDLTDTPGTYGAAGQVVVVNGSATGLAFANAPAGTFIGLTDTPGSFTANAFVRVNSGGTALEFDAALAASDISDFAVAADTRIAVSSLLDHADTPVAYGTAGHSLVVNGTGDGFITAARSTVASFDDLDDVPGTKSALRFLRANAGGTALEYVPLGYALISDFGAGVDAQIALASILDLADTPGALGAAGQALVVNSGGTALEFSSTAGATSFVGLTDTPGSLGSALSLVRVNSGGTALEFGTLGLAGLTDVSTAPSAAGQILFHNGTDVRASSVTSLADGDAPVWSAANSRYENKAALKTDLSGSPYTAGKLLAANGTDYIDLAVGTDGYALVADSGEAAGLAYANLGDGTLPGLTDVQNFVNTSFTSDQFLVLNHTADEWQARDTKLLPFLAAYSQTFVAGDWSVVSDTATLTIAFATHTKIVPVKVILYRADGGSGFDEVLPDLINFDAATSPDITIEIPAGSVFDGKVLVL